MLDTLSRTKESIGKASHHAIHWKSNLAHEVSLIYVIFQYGKQAAHFMFSYCGFFTFKKITMKIVKIRLNNEYLAYGSFLHS